MTIKIKEKKRAVELRKQGKTYSEILKKVPVAKSTLSLWLRDVGLSKPQLQVFTEKRRKAQLRGAQARKDQRIEVTKKIKNEARSDIMKISKRDLWLIGVALYWAEGSKEKEWRPGEGLSFANSDSDMIRIYLKWLKEIMEVSNNEIKCRIHIHENHSGRLNEISSYWEDVSSIKKEDFGMPNFKKHNPRTRRKNIGRSYKGLLEVRVQSSSSMNRKVAGWIEGITKFV